MRALSLFKHLNTYLTTSGKLSVPCHIIARGCHRTKVLSNKQNMIPCETTKLSRNDSIKLTASNGKELTYPWLWLRDNCQCESCFNPQMHSRTINWRHFDISVCPISYKIENNILSVKWSDGHESSYSLQWLEDRSFTHEAQEKWLTGVYRHPRSPWKASTFPEILKRFDCNEVLESDNQLFEWLKCLAIHGIAIIENTPSKEDQLRKLANRVAFIKRTHYGEEFEVRNKPDTTNLAYLAIPLQMHSDIPYYEYKPGVNMLHCLVQTNQGGENQFVDCLYLSQYFKETDPDTYKILSTVPVEWADIGEENKVKFHSLYRAPVICENKSGEFVRVNYNQWQRDSHFSVPLENVIPWYKANAIFTKALYHPDNMVQIKTNPGEIVTFDNIRLLHGRSGYTDSTSNERHIIGSYLDWDTVYSKIRILQQNLFS